MAILPCAVFSSPDISDSIDLIRQLLNVEELPTSEEDNGYKWNINNKYYTAQVQLYALPDATSQVCRQYPDSVQAVILYFDADEEESFKTVKHWLPFLSQNKPDIQIIVCRHCSDFTAVPRMTVLKWCVENAMELVELKPDLNEEEDFQESYGISRIIQALHAHTWPNLVMKQPGSPFCKTFLNEIVSKKGSEVSNKISCGLECDRKTHREEISKLENSQPEEDCVVDDNIDIGAAKQLDQESVENESREKQTEKFFKDESEDASLYFESVESFESLCAKIKHLQVKGNLLTPNQRRKYAEKATLSFWRAIGGNSDEIDDSSDTDVET
ncbi:alpha- and gamma-adaptin-binding protein p34-like isoform X2 [Octopus bimaculoides]|uniref:alpha- and gamma-adaptin-binding protein p34-like isoform X2 n=1 Tax=Octopus bimaculoides TaxID=37653 RepID=UPI0022E3065C|nr:alpha- and gamma-adaptin-binding protein p34-like isoform X2 [Octopus bimaculoides]